MAGPVDSAFKSLTGSGQDSGPSTFSQTSESGTDTKSDQPRVESHCHHNECVFRPSEDADRLGKRVQQTVDRAARLLRSMDASHPVVTCLKDIVICVTRIRSRLFPYYGDGSAHTRYIRDGSVNVLFIALDKFIKRMQVHAVLRAQESTKAVRVASILSDPALVGDIWVFYEWEDFARKLQLPNDSFNSTLRLVAEIFDIAILHPAIHLHDNFPRHPIWNLEDDLKSTSLALNDLACFARAEDADYRTVLLTMEQCLNPQEYNSVMGLVHRGSHGPDGPANPDSPSTSSDSRSHISSNETSAGSEAPTTPSSTASTSSTGRDLPASGRVSVPEAITEVRCQQYKDGKHDCETAACAYVLAGESGDEDGVRTESE